MNCLKCGRETQEDHVFCDSCRQEMEAYPVRPGTAVMLPQRREEAASKKTKRHVKAPVSMEDQVRRLKKQRFWISFTAILIVLALISALVLTYVDYNKKAHRPGQNYSSTQTTAPVSNP